MKSLAIRTATVIIAIFFILYVGYQSIRYFNNPYKTEVVFRTSIEETIRVDGIAIRNESVLESTSYDGIDYQFKNGEKAKKNAKIADYYSTNEQVEALKKIRELQDVVEKLEQAAEKKDSYVLDAEALNKQIQNSLIEYLDICDSKFTDGLYDAKNDLLLALNKRIIGVDNTADFSGRIALLKEQIKLEQSKVSSPLGAVYTSNSGYFVNFADGFEKILSKDNYTNFSVSELTDYIKGKNAPEKVDSVGKVILDPDWYFAVSVEGDGAEKFTVSRQVDIYFPFKNTEKVSATVVDVITDSVSGKSVAILKLSSVSENLSQVRTATVQVAFKTVTGLRLNKNAVRFNDDNVQGVYVLNGEQILFKKIDIIYDAKGYYLTRYNESDSEYLRLYDDVIVEGKDLYDKKTVN